MIMERADVEEQMREALSCPILSRRLQGVVVDIEERVGDENSKEVLYELVDILMQVGQRVRALEVRVVSSCVGEELSIRSDHGARRKIDYSEDFPKPGDHAKHRG